MKVKISGTGSYLPDRCVSNDELSTMVDTSDQWIQQRAGIQSRHIAQVHETTSFMAAESAKKALASAQLRSQDIDLIVVATSTADNAMPSCASLVQGALGIEDCIAFDLNAACSGFIYAVSTAQAYFKSGMVKHALIIGAERMSRLLDWDDRSTCVLFGDGAGAAVFSAVGHGESALLSTHIHSTGAHKDLLYVSEHFSAEPFAHSRSGGCINMLGNKVFKFAVNKLGEIVDEVLSSNQLERGDIDWLIPHQANSRIIEATAKKLNLPMSRVVLTLAQHGNTSAASVPLALDHAVQQGDVKRGELLLLEAFGAGFVWGAALIRY